MESHETHSHNNRQPPVNPPLLPAPDDAYLPAETVEVQSGPASLAQVMRFLMFLLKYWWVLVITLGLSVGAAATYILLKDPTYQSQASMWETVKLRLPEGAIFSEDAGTALGPQAAVLQSRTLTDQAQALLQLSSNSVPIPKGKDGKPLEVTISVRGSAKSSVYQIDASSSNQRYTQNYLNALMQAYLDYKRNIRRVISGDTLASISEQVQRWERDLKAEQDALIAFQRTNNMAILEEQGTIAGGYLARLKTQLSDLQLEARLLDAALNNQQQTNADGTNDVMNWSSLASGIGPATPPAQTVQRQSAFNEVEVLKLQRERLSKYLRPKHPKIIKLDADIERGENLEAVFRRQSRDQLVGSRQANQLKTANVLESIKEWEANVVEANNRIAEADRLKRNVQRVQSVYDRLTALVQSVGINRNIDQESLAILEPASPAERTFSREIGAVALSLMAGLALGLAIVFLVAVRDDRFTSVTEVNSRLGDVVVGMLPEMSKADGGSELSLLVHDDPRHVYAESYRSLRSALLFLGTEGERPKTLLITSALPNEGKSTVAANLARMLALSGSRVLLVDADLRKGHLHSMLNLPSAPGLAELLSHTSDEAHVIQINSLANLAFIACGKNPGNPGDLFLAAGLDKVLAQWREKYDYVIIDSSPLFAADDASCLAPKVDGTLFVVRSRLSRARPVREALDLLYRRNARVLGVVFNGANASARSYYYYQYADYNAGAKST